MRVHNIANKRYDDSIHPQTPDLSSQSTALYMDLRTIVLPLYEGFIFLKKLKNAIRSSEQTCQCTVEGRRKW